MPFKNLSMLSGGVVGLFVTLSQTVIAEESGDKTQILVLSALHGAHQSNPNYSYEDLYKLVADFNPDYVGVEMRPEDMKAGADYLRRNYPKEMIELATRYQNNSFGFDWLGAEIEGMPVPADYWRTNHYVSLLQQMAVDADFQEQKPESLDALSDQQSAMATQSSPVQLMDGRYGAITRQIDALEDIWYGNGPYRYVFDFNAQRDEEIGRNIAMFLKAHEGARVVLVMGADHRTYAIENIERALGDAVVITDVANRP